MPADIFRKCNENDDHKKKENLHSFLKFKT